MKVTSSKQNKSLMGLAKTVYIEYEYENTFVQQETKYLFGVKYKENVKNSPVKNQIGFTY